MLTPHLSQFSASKTLVKTLVTLANASDETSDSASKRNHKWLMVSFLETLVEASQRLWTLLKR